jgi:hypothetical protein
MSRARLASAAAGLALGLLFYVAHRTDQTLSNRIVAWICGPAAYLQLKQALRDWLPVPSFLVGCLPSALWCFVVTSLCGAWKIRLRARVVPIAWLAPLGNAGWEIVQGLGWTDGHGDWLDAAAGVGGGLLAKIIFTRAAQPAETISIRWNWRLAVVTTSFACMGLADVWK